MIEREVDYDEIYDQLEDVDDLQPLAREKMNLSLSALGGEQSGRKDYSLINYEETTFKFTVLYDFLKFVPKSHKVKVMINGLVRLCQQMLFAPANRRRLRFEEQEAQAKYWQSRLSKDDQVSIAEADRLLALWGRQDLLQEQIRRRRLRDGLAAVDAERARWHTCDRKKEIVEELATRLPTEAYEYFVARKEQYHIQREQAEDRAKGVPTRDFSMLIQKIQSGEVQPAEVIIDGPWPLYEAFEVAVQEVDPANPHWDHIRQLQAATAKAMRRNRRGKWSRRDGDDQGSDDA